MLRPDQVLVIYDGECPFCSGVVHWLRRLDWRDRMVCLPFQTRGLPEAAGTTVQRARREALALSPGGHLWSGGGTVAAVLDMLLPFGLPLFRAIYLIPGVHLLANKIYSVVSENRHRLASGKGDLEPGEEPHLDPDVAQELTRRRMASRMPSALPGPALEPTIH